MPKVLPLAFALSMTLAAAPWQAQARQDAASKANVAAGKPVADKPAAAAAQPEGAAAAAGQPEAADHPANSAAPGDAKHAMLRAQVLLDRARFAPGEIDGSGGSNTRRAIAAFQASHGLPGKGELDQATWDALNADAAPVLVEYTVTAADVAGPFRELPDDMLEKAELDALGFESAHEALGEKFHASPALLKRLNPGKDLAVAGTAIVVPAVGRAPLADVAKVIVDKSDSVLQLLDAGGKVLAQFPASTGSERDPLPLGDWTVKAVATDPTFHYNPELFWDADPAHAKATLAPGPNNPVGVAWVGLSKEHYGIHGTPEPARVGKTDSNGCIRLSNWDVRALAAVMKPGMPVLLQE